MVPEIKICGLKYVSDAYYVNEAKVQYAGMVFHGKSKRNVSEMEALRLMEYLDPSIKKVAVCVSPNYAKVEKIAEMGFDIVQIHGKLRKKIAESHLLPLWYAVNVKNLKSMEKQMETIVKFHDYIDGFVVDGESYGSGVPFDWDGEEASSVRLFTREKPFVLSGGLKASNIQEAIGKFNPDIVDVSTGVESITGDGKDEQKILEFAKAVRGE